MPKKKDLTGIGDAFDVDVRHVKEGERPETLNEDDSFKRVTISLSPSLLKKLDKVVKNQKERGASINRSSYIARAVMVQIEKDIKS